EEKTFPDSIFERFGELGFLGLRYPPEYGGQGGDYFSAVVLSEEMARAGSGGLGMAVAVQTEMATPPVFKFGTEEQKRRWLAPAIQGKQIASIATTEPDAGSDVAGISTVARRVGDEFIGGGRDRRGAARLRVHDGLRAQPAGVRPADRQLPGHQAPARRHGHQDRLSAGLRLSDGEAVGPGRVPGARDLAGEADGDPGRVRGGRRRDPDPGWPRLHARVSGRARVAGRPARPHRRRDGRDHEGDHRQVVRTVSSAVLFAGCEPEVAAFGERILAVGPRARATAGRGAEVVRLSGTAWPGLIDARIHLEVLADAKLSVDLTGAASLSVALARIREWARPLPRDAWVVGSGWYNDAWPDASFPSRRQLDAAVGGRPAYLRRKDGHSAWASSAALRIPAVSRGPDDPAGGSIDRDEGREPTGILRETAMGLVARRLPVPGEAELDGAMDRVLGELARSGLTGVHSMDGARAL